ncbi:S41 family peptidase [Allosphingosinicella flava]|uniref:S41 family peptidase n=1 Tax=Allosphingosinicella flava TaxID=2771430 RepID=A0A7T2LLZ6_9SPHN|nr:S41 family peptidase [Sphingosinicella flava]QPQ55030.1 S41 family peptidase [Sphingosinicella flava]
MTALLKIGALCVALSGLSAQAVAIQGTRSAQPQVTAPKLLTAADRKGVVDNIAIAADARYVDPAGGKKIAAHMRAQLAKGAYDRLTDPVEFASALTRDMRAAVADVHLRAVYEPNRAQQTVRMAAPAAGAVPQPGQGGGTAGPRSFARIDQRSDEQIARTNYGFDAVQHLDGNVGYLKLNRFVPLAMSEETAKAAMAFLANTDAVIIDLRGNIGGSPDLVRHLMSYFTGPEPMQLLSNYIREGNRSDRMMSLAEVPGRRMTGKPLYVLIDADSASSAEMFAYIAQRKQLGTVFGQKSSGAGNGGNMLPAGSGISVFLPFARITDGPGWEQIGVTPDVAVDPEAAMAAAHKAALQKLIAAATDPVAKREREWALELAMAGDRASAPAGGLADYEGQFGTRGFKVAEGKLMVVPSAGRPEALVRTGAETFRLDNARYTFERDAAGQVTGVKVETLSGTETRADKTPSA